MKSLVRHIFVILTAALAMGGAGCSAKAKKARHLERAGRHFSAQALDKAEIEYMNVLQLDGRDATAISRLAIIYFEQGRLGRMVPFLMKAREVQPDNLEVRTRLASAFVTGGHWSEARTEALFVLQRDPANPRAPLFLAEASTQPDEIEQARQHLRSLPATPAIGVALALLDLRQRKIPEAQAALERILASDPKSASAHLALGNLHWSMNRLPAAEAALAHAARLSPIRSVERLRLAHFLRHTGRSDQAKRVLQEVTTAAADFIPAWVLLAEIVAGEKKYDESLAAVGKALALDPMHPEAILLDARVRVARGEPEKAIADLERAAAIYPGFAPVHYQLGLAYVASGELSKAAASLGQTLTIAPQFASATMSLAELNIRMGNTTAAIASLKQLTQQHTTAQPAWMLLAQAYRAHRDSATALATYQHIDKTFPSQPQVSLQIGLVLLDLDRKADAAKAFANALRLDAAFLPAVDQLVNLDLEAKNYFAARQRAEECVNRNPKSADAHLIMARVFLTESDVKRAEATLLKTIQLNPDATVPYFLLARLYLGSDDRQKALANLEQAAIANPKGVEAFMMIGVVHEQQKNYTAARAAYEKLLIINPKFSAALNNLAHLYSEHFNELDKAYAMAQRARELLPNEPHVADTLGWILYKRKQFPWALSLLAESAERLPDSAEIHFHLGMTHYVLGEEAPARAALDRAVKLGSDFQGVEQARQALAVLDVDPATATAAKQAELEKAAAGQVDPVALSRLGAIHERSGDHAKAATAYEAALKASPNNLPAALGLIRTCVHRNDRTRALELAKATRKLAPADPVVAHALGRLAFESGDHAWALSLLQDAVRARADDPETMYDFARAAYSVGQVAAAEGAVGQALAGGTAFSRAEEAKVLQEMIALAANPKAAATALAKIEAVLKSDPAHGPALMAQVAALQSKGDARGAGEICEKMLVHYPQFTPAKRQLVLLRAEHPADDQKAVELATKAREAFPDDAQLAKAFGMIVLRQQNYTRAISLLQESSRRLTNDAELFYYLGLAQQHAKDAASVQSLQRALELGLRTELASEARRVLAAAK